MPSVNYTYQWDRYKCANHPLQAPLQVCAGCPLAPITRCHLYLAQSECSPRQWSLASAGKCLRPRQQAQRCDCLRIGAAPARAQPTRAEIRPGLRDPGGAGTDSHLPDLPRPAARGTDARWLAPPAAARPGDGATNLTTSQGAAMSRHAWTHDPALHYSCQIGRQAGTCLQQKAHSGQRSNCAATPWQRHHIRTTNRPRASQPRQPHHNGSQRGCGSIQSPLAPKISTPATAREA
jgi:hypothetical protein